MKITKFNNKLNYLQNNIYTIEEVLHPVGGVVESVLIHDNIAEDSINVYTGSKLTGDKIKTFVISTPSKAPWTTSIKIFSDLDTVYVTYETKGDTVEADDVNNLQTAVNETQIALNNEVDRATNKETEINNALTAEINRATTKENSINTALTNEVNRAKSAESTLNTNISNEVTRAKNKETEINNALTAEINRAKGEESTLKTNLTNEVSRATTRENEINANLTAEINRAKAKESEIDTALSDRYTKSEVFTKSEVLAKIQDLINSAPEVLDTFGEIAEALGNDPNFAATMTTMLSQKVDKVSGKALSTNDFDNTQKSNLADAYNKRHTHDNKSVIDGITSALVSTWNNAYTHISDTVKHITSTERTLWNTVTNKVNKSGDTINGHVKVISDANPLSIERNGSPNLSIKFNNVTSASAGTRYLGTYKGTSLRFGDNADLAGAYEVYHTGRKPAKGDVGLGNVDNTSDLNKPISTATQTALNGKANASHTHTKSQITDMPTKLSQFTNDRGFITSADVDTSQNHTHSNKAVLDGITSAKITSWDNKLSLSGGTVTSSTIFQQGISVTGNIASNGSGTTGYQHIAQIKITGNYFNQAISFKVAQRWWYGDFTILFNGGDTIDPSLNKIVKTGNIVPYIVKSATSTWNIYLKKQEAYDSITITDLYAGDYARSRMTLTWKNELVTQLPTGYIEATLDQINVGVTRATQDSDGKQINTTYVKKGCTWNDLKGV